MHLMLYLYYQHFVFIKNNTHSSKNEYKRRTLS